MGSVAGVDEVDQLGSDGGELLLDGEEIGVEIDCRAMVPRRIE
jgi:hypothetical protein